MNITRRDIIVFLLFALLVSAIVFSFEAYEEEVDSFNLPIVYKEPFLALQKALEKTNTDTIKLNKPFELFDEGRIIVSVDDTILFNEGEIVLSKNHAQQLLEWAKNGGYLVMGLSGQSGESVFGANHLLKELGIVTQNSDSESRSSFLKDTLINTDEYGDIEVSLNTVVYIQSETESYYIGYPHNSEKPEPIVNYDMPTAIQIEYGEGLISFVTSTHIWTNFYIDKKDNVLLAHNLLGGVEKLYLVEYFSPSMWYQRIAEYSPAFYWSLLLLILVSLWHVAVRFGPIKKIDMVVVTYFTQHIKAAGEFYWGNNQRKRLIDEVRAQIFDDLSIRSAKNRASQEALLGVISKISNWPDETLHKVLIQEHDTINQQQFLKIMQSLQQLRKMI